MDLLGAREGAFAEQTEPCCWARGCGEPRPSLGCKELREPRAEGKAFLCARGNVPGGEGTLLAPLPLVPLHGGNSIRHQPQWEGSLVDCIFSAAFWFWGDCGSPKHLLSPYFLLFSSDPTFGKRNFEPMLTVELCGTAGRTGF